MSYTKYFTGGLLAASLLVSCKKDVTYDVTGDPEVKFFTNNVSAGNLPDNALGFNIVNYPNAAGGEELLNLSTSLPDTIKIPVFSTRPVSQDVVIHAELDTSLIAAYNAAHNTSYSAFPAGILKTSGLSAKLMKGSSTSVESIAIPTVRNGLHTLTGKAYMAPIRLTTVSNRAAGQISAGSTSQVTYVVAGVELRRIKYLAVAADAQGTLVSPRTGWSSSFMPAPSINGSIFDGSTTTYTRWTASPAQVDVNMQGPVNVTGIRLHTATSATYVPTRVDVYLSQDGINYDLIGSPLKANITYAASYNYILFYKAIQAQYIRLVLYYVTNTNTQNYRLTELDVYAGL